MRTLQPKLPADFIPLELLGAGGEGEVWLAQQRHTGERIAVKRLQVCGSAEAQKHRLDALSRATGLEISGLATIRRTEVTADVQWVVSDYIEGRPLSEWQGPMSPISVLRIVVQIAQTLKQLAAMNLAHGDVSPANVIIDERGSVTLIDLGLVDRDLRNCTEVGTPSFSTVCENTSDFDRDWHALGALIAWLLSGVAVQMPVDDEGRRWSSPPDLPSTSNMLARELWQLATLLFETPPPTPEMVVSQLQRLLGSDEGVADSALGIWSTHRSSIRATSSLRPPSINPIRAYWWRWCLGIFILAAFLWLVWVQDQGTSKAPIGIRVQLMAESPRSNLPSGFDMTWLNEQLLSFLPSGSIAWRDAQSRPNDLVEHYWLQVRCLEIFCLMVLGEEGPSSPTFQSILMPEDSLEAWRSALLGLLLSAQIAVQDRPDRVLVQGADSEIGPDVKTSPE